MSGTWINSVKECYIDVTEERLLLCGGDESYLEYFEIELYFYLPY